MAPHVTYRAKGRITAPPVENRLDDVRREKGETQDPAQIRLVDIVGFGQLVHRNEPAGRSQRWAQVIALTTRGRWAVDAGCQQYLLSAASLPGPKQ